MALPVEATLSQVAATLTLRMGMGEVATLDEPFDLPATEDGDLDLT